MGANTFNEMEIDALGEIMNISLGASATAVSTMLGTAVHITTPVVSVVNGTTFEFVKLEPAVGVEIAYVEGLEGSNVMMFSRDDVRIIVGMLMGMEIPMEQFELDEINRSAVCEVMNQMMGSAATALSEFLGYPVNISTPVSFEVTDHNGFNDKYFPTGEDYKVVVRFNLEVEGKIKSEFLNIMSIGLAKKLLKPFAASFGGMLEEPEEEPIAEPEPEIPMPSISGGSEKVLSQEAIEALMAATLQEAASASAPEPVPQPIPAPAPAPTVQPVPEPAVQPTQPAQPMPQMQPMQMMPQMQMAPAAADPLMLQLLSQMQQSQMQMMEMMNDMRGRDKKKSPEPAQQQSPSVIHPMNSSHLEVAFEDGEEDAVNQEMLMKVPLEVSVEIGRTKKLVKDILEYTQGSLVVLDKMAGEQADLYVNGRCIARGDIVVVEDNFGIRITEIVTRNLNPETL
ncbi:MAG: flagellar motor switch protein FliN [Lachnospiraceae bacterium]|nr:flagellar motor switch protein FliN [Lachnospiraceae bacterium]